MICDPMLPSDYFPTPSKSICGNAAAGTRWQKFWSKTNKTNKTKKLFLTLLKLPPHSRSPQAVKLVDVPEDQKANAPYVAASLNLHRIEYNSFFASRLDKTKSGECVCFSCVGILILV